MALSKIKSTSLETNATNLVKLEDINVTSSVSAVEINIDYSGYIAFKLVIKELNRSGTSTANFQFRVKRDGQSSFDSGSSDYGNQGILYDTAATRNNNGNVSSISMMTAGNGVQNGFAVEALMVGAQETDRQFLMHGILGSGGSNTNGTFAFGGSRHNNNEKVTDIQLTDTAQNVGKCVGTLYGLKA